MAKKTVMSVPAGKKPSTGEGLVFAVYAPFGTDPVLSGFPDNRLRPIERQPLLKNLRAVASQGVNVSALIDLVDDDSWLVEIPAGQPERTMICSAWKQDMGSPHALAGFLRRTHQRFPCSALVLALEGHGAGYLPDIDGSAISPATTNGDSEWQWRISRNATELRDGSGGAPALPFGFPSLPVHSPEITPVRLPLSTWGLAAALRSARRAGVPKPAVVHFNNCFNMAVEHLHTVAPHADYATGYTNYNFFTAGAAYPKVFERLREQGPASAEQLAQWFAAANHDMLRAKGNHPTIGGTIRLARMKTVAAAVDALGDALVGALRPADPLERPAVLQTVRDAIAAAMHFDTSGDYTLAVPDQTTDLGGLAVQLHAAFPAGPVHAAAAQVLAALQGVWQYGDFEHPWMDETKTWDFDDDRLGMSIFLPDPDLAGSWDWRTPYYMAGTVDPSKPPAQKHQIDFLADRGTARPPWVEFIVEYHRDVVFQGLRRVLAPVFPTFNKDFKPTFPPPTRDDPRPGDPNDPKDPTRY